MDQKITKTSRSFCLAIAVLLQVYDANSQERIHRYNDAFVPEGYHILRQDEKGLLINFSINQFSTIEKKINNETLQNLAVSGMFLQNEAGNPDLPANGRYIAIPQGAKAILKVLSYHADTIRNINIAPAPVVPLATDDSPLVYERNPSVYSRNAFFPEAPVKLFDQTKIRGIDVVMFGVSPFQYNPITRDLIIHKDMKIEISFEGGNGHFGDDAYRSRWWEPILSDHILNYSQITAVDANIHLRKSNPGITADTGYEYVIIIPNAPEFSQWADSIKKFRTEQGILTHVFTLAQIGGTTTTDIQTWISDAYNNWDIKPTAMLILADYGTDANTTVISKKYPHMAGGYPDFASDNFYADVTGEGLPDIVCGRIAANNASELQVMCSKFLNYERNPPTSASFYDKPLIALGWQDDRWFQLCAEIVGGFFNSIGKNHVRVNALGIPAANAGNNVPNTGIWSTVNPTTVLNYYGPTGLNYIPDKPGTLGGFSGGNATAVNAAINNGAFLAFHRDHGSYQAWGDPNYTNTSINSLTNTGNKLPFVFSINCQTGAFHHTSESFAEKFHRYTKNGQNSGALGLIADSEASYSFYNDIMVWGMFDNLWPNFIPAYGTNPPSLSRDKRPAFANTSAKYYLQQSNWVTSAAKLITYQMYHMFGDPFQWFYSEVPQNLTVVHNSMIGPSELDFTVMADSGAFIALTIPGPGGPIILGTATSAGFSVSIPLSQPVTSTMLVTVTKQDYFRYKSTVIIGNTTSINDNSIAVNSTLTCFPNPFNQVTTISYMLGQSENVTLSVFDMLGKEVSILIENKAQSAGTHQIQFSAKDLPKGIYSCVLKTGSQVITKTIVIKE